MDLASTIFGYFILGLMSTAFLINSCEGAGSFRNPILDTPSSDQHIYLHTDGYYYMTQPSGTDLYLYKSEALSDWRLAERKLIHTKNGTGTNYAQSEIHFLGGNWYIYYHSLNAVVSQYHVFVIEAQNPDNPFGGYSDEMRLTPATPQEDYDDIEVTILEVSSSGSLYFIYAGYASNNTGPRKIFITPMSNATTISGPRVLIRDTMSTWDTDIRSPQILRESENENQTFLVFTGRTEGVDCLGLMGIQDEKDPLVAGNWWHYPNGSVFESNSIANVYSPGFISLTYSPDFSESRMAYRARTTDNGTDWTSRLEKIEWNEDGTPRFPTPTALTTPLPLPSGEIS